MTELYLQFCWLKVPLPWLHRHNWLLAFWQSGHVDVSFFFYLWRTLPIDWLKMMLCLAKFNSYLVAMVPATFCLFENWFRFKLTWLYNIDLLGKKICSKEFHSFVLMTFLNLFLKIWVVNNLRVWEHFGSRKSYKQIDKIHKDFEPNAVTMYNFVGQNIQIFALYIFLIRKINTFWSKCFSEVSGYLSQKYHTRKICKVHKDFWIIPGFHT